MAALLQPLVQIAASVPATALFPVFLLFMLALPVGLSLAAVLLMLMGTQWYFLFNVIAGAAVIPRELQSITVLLHMTRWQQWRTLILPALFPSIITGLQRPTAGQVLYRGKPLAGVNPYASIVFQNFALFPWLTVLGNVEGARKARGVSAKDRGARALDLLDRVGLNGFETAYPRELSGGMRQKVGFTRAMAVEPELLCLDEPFSALDVLSAETLRGELLELWTSGRIPTRAMLMVTHSIEEAVFMADRIIVMEKEPGRVVQNFQVALPHSRMRKAPAFLEIVDQVYGILAGQTQAEYVELGSAPGEPGRT